MEYGAGGHEVLDVLPEDLVLRPQPEVLLLDVVHPRAEVVEGVLQLEDLGDEPGLLLLLLAREVVAFEDVDRGEGLGAVVLQGQAGGRDGGGGVEVGGGGVGQRSGRLDAWKEGKSFTNRSILFHIFQNEAKF